MNIISFDVPFPANYGGVIDVYYKIKALHDLGIKVHLHCFEYGRKPAKELENLCIEVHYYHRRTGKGHLLSQQPFIVATRSNEELVNRLSQTDFPILFEGLHTCWALQHPKLAQHRKVVRTHNIEHNYYAGLAKSEKNLFKRYYFKTEADKLKRFEKTILKADAIAAISAPDVAHFAQSHHHVKQVSAFHPNTEVSILSGKGSFCLYHGSLEIAENNQAALYLVEKVFGDTKIPLVIAGNKPSAELLQAASRRPNITIKDHVTTDEIHQLIREAQVNVLPTFQATGIKLKLLAALFMGRHCVVNGPMVEGTGLERYCRVDNSDKRLRSAVEELFQKPFTHADVTKRMTLNTSAFSNKENALKLIELLFPE